MTTNRIRTAENATTVQLTRAVDRRRPQPGWAVWPYRTLITASTLLLFNQAVYAGQFLSGTFEALLTHRENATYAGIGVAVSAVAAVLLVRPGRGPWWPIPATAVLFALIALQIVLGFGRMIAVHIPLGVSIIGGGAALTAWSWRYRPGPTTPATGQRRRASDPDGTAGQAT